MNKLCVALLAAMTLAPPVARAQAGTLNAAEVPAAGARPQDFATPGWKIAARAGGDLNDDGRTDQVLQLVTAGTPDDRSDTDAAPEAHALLILFAEGGKFRRAGLATRLLAPFVPQYSLGLKVRGDGVLVVEQDYGMNDVTHLKHLLRYEPRAGRFLLIGRDKYSYTRPLRGHTVKTSENYLTGVRSITVRHFRRGDGVGPETTRREQLGRSMTYLEDVDEDPVR